MHEQNNEQKVTLILKERYQEGSWVERFTISRLPELHIGYAKLHINVYGQGHRTEPKTQREPQPQSS